MDWLSAFPQMEQHETTDPKKANVRYVYQWMNNVPLHGGEKAIRVNYLDVSEAKSIYGKMCALTCARSFFELGLFAGIHIGPGEIYYRRITGTILGRRIF